MDASRKVPGSIHDVKLIIQFKRQCPENWVHITFGGGFCKNFSFSVQQTVLFSVYIGREISKDLERDKTLLPLGKGAAAAADEGMVCGNDERIAKGNGKPSFYFSLLRIHTRYGPPQALRRQLPPRGAEFYAKSLFTPTNSRRRQRNGR